MGIMEQKMQATVQGLGALKGDIGVRKGVIEK